MIVINKHQHKAIIYGCNDNPGQEQEPLQEMPKSRLIFKRFMQDKYLAILFEHNQEQTRWPEMAGFAAGAKGQCPLFYNRGPRWLGHHQTPAFCPKLSPEARSSLQFFPYIIRIWQDVPLLNTGYLEMQTPKSFALEIDLLGQFQALLNEHPSLIS